ncbi:MAG TPA: hypothetical protein VN833_14290 [Candidatus Acidoferrales bacterium]|nr:hypothetical protein [Candidatus Acidoferrales bacterium]
MDTMYALALGVALMIAGIVLLLIGRKGGPKNTSVTATGGSVAIGGSNTGQITNINRTSLKTSGHGGHGITILAIIVEILGMGVVIWHAWHLAH